MNDKPTFGSLFAGIGGIDLGLERAGWTCKWQVENDPYCLAVLRKHWPNIPKFGDVKQLDGSELEPVDLICGGFPCQPVSCAGKRKAQADERWLWPEFARIIRMVRPRFVLVENVPGILSANGGRAMGEVLGDLAACGYDAEWNRLSATSVGAPHLRERIFIVAYTVGERWRGRRNEDDRWQSRTLQTTRSCSRDQSPILADSNSRRRQVLKKSNGRETHRLEASQRNDLDRCCYTMANSDKSRMEGTTKARYFGTEGQVALKLAFRHNTSDGGNWTVEPNVGRVAHGVPARVDRLRCLGNAVVPACAEWIGKQIMRVLA